MIRSPVLPAINQASAITLLGVLSGGAALWATATGHTLLMLSGVALALLTDFLDGLVARRLRQTSARLVNTAYWANAEAAIPRSPGTSPAM